MILTMIFLFCATAWNKLMTQTKNFGCEWWGWQSVTIQTLLYYYHYRSAIEQILTNTHRKRGIKVPEKTCNDNNCNNLNVIHFLMNTSISSFIVKSRMFYTHPKTYLSTALVNLPQEDVRMNTGRCSLRNDRIHCCTSAEHGTTNSSGCSVPYSKKVSGSSGIKIIGYKYISFWLKHILFLRK